MTIGRVIDVSSNQHPGNAPINWKEVAGAGVTTAIIKATQGTNYVNPFFHSDVAGALAAGLEVMAYHYADFGSSAQLEAEFFLGVAGHLAQCLDIETSENAAWARSFMQALGRPAAELLVYGSASSLVGIHAQIPALAWPAAYGQGYPGWGVLWQFTSTARIPGIVGNCDEDQWHGSEIQYETLFGTTAPPQELEMLAPTPTDKGFWTCSAAGAIITHGDAEYLGGPNTSNTAPEGQPPAWNGPPNLIPGHVITSIVACNNEQGYWCEDNDGNLYAYGAAKDWPVN